MENAINKISGFGNKNANQQFYQTTATGAVQTYNFNAFVPVNGNVTFNALTEKGGTDVKTSYNVSGIYYQDQLYTGRFTSFNMATGEILIYLV